LNNAAIYHGMKLVRAEKIGAGIIGRMPKKQPGRGGATHTPENNAAPSAKNRRKN